MQVDVLLWKTLTVESYRLTLDIYTDKKNRPSVITANQMSNPGGASGQKAAQMKCLVLYFPLLIGDRVNEDSEYWELFVLILDIFKSCNEFKKIVLALVCHKI